MPTQAIHADAPGGVDGFEQRYGFRNKPVLIRFRLLDSGLQGLTDLTVPAGQFAS